MGKALAQKAGIAAVETTLRAGMPELIRTLESLQADIRGLRTMMDARFDKVDEQFDKVDARFDKVDARFEKVDARFERVEERLAQVERGPDQIRLEFREQFADFYERLLTAINEVSHRVTRADQKLEDYSEFTRLASSKVHDFLERVVRVEAAQQSTSKKRRAG